MTFPTACIGLLPTYADIGLMAAVLMACMRFLQGVSAGGEFTGAICYLTEFAPPDKRGIMGSWVFFGSQIGAIASVIEFLLLGTFVDEKQLLEWGWRLTFIIGGLIGLTGWYLRKKLKETPPFMMLRNEGKVRTLPIIDTFRNYKIPVIKAFFLSALPLSGWYMVFIYTPVYSAEILERDFTQQMLILLGMIVLSNLSLPFFGILGDKGYSKILWSISSLGGILLAYPLFIAHDSFVLDVFLRALAAILFSIQYALLPMLICGLFPTSVRYTGVGISYNFCNIFLGGGAPVIILLLSGVTENYLVPIIFLASTALLSWIAFFLIKDKHLPNQGAVR
jgi:MHS family proline/betaine transporter-like MFS transporter